VLANPQYGYTYHHLDAGKANYRKDLDAVATALTGAKDIPLNVRLDAFWGDIDMGSFDGNVWRPNLRMKKIDDIFTKVLRPRDMAILILSTHSPPSKLKPLFPFESPAQWRHPEAANNFVEGIVKHVAQRGLLDRVLAWQISDEPNNLAFSHVANWNEIVGPLNTFLETIRRNDDARKPRIINMYQVAPSLASLFFRHDPWDELFSAAEGLHVPISSNFEMMGADIYPDQWGHLERSQDGFQKAVDETIQQLDRAKQRHGFQGTWGILEMPGGPRAGLLPGTVTPSPQEIADYISIAKRGNPAMIIPFQVRGSTESGDLSHFYGNSYGLIDSRSGVARNEYLRAIQHVVRS
jgi:hypothetical protein